MTESERKFISKLFPMGRFKYCLYNRIKRKNELKAGYGYIIKSDKRHYYVVFEDVINTAATIDKAFDNFVLVNKDDKILSQRCLRINYKRYHWLTALKKENFTNEIVLKRYLKYIRRLNKVRLNRYNRRRERFGRPDEKISVSEEDLYNLVFTRKRKRKKKDEKKSFDKII